VLQAKTDADDESHDQQTLWFANVCVFIFFGRSMRCCTILSSYLYSYDMVIVDSAALVLLKFQWLTYWGFSV